MSVNFSQKITVVSNKSPLPEKTVERLSMYRRSLLDCISRGKFYIFSHEIANLLHITPVQVRRDIMLIGYSGTLPAVYRRAFSSPGEKPLAQMREELEGIEKKIKGTDPIIFLTHDAPYGTKLDIIRSRNEQGGNKALTEFIERVKPIINVHGHIHENRGTARIAETFLINPGAVVDGRGAIYDTEKTTLRMFEGFSQGIKLLAFIYKIRTKKDFK